MAKIDASLHEILAKWHDDPNKAVWDCHGTWVAYHKALESIAARAGITFDPPQIIEADGARRVAAICVVGHMESDQYGRTEWSIGEASPENYKIKSEKMPAYPWAMAEKRAKDRVILKLLGLHGQIYSEEESDDFKANGSVPASSRMSSASAKRVGIADWIKAKIAECNTEKDLDTLTDDLAAIRDALPAAWADPVTDFFENARNELQKGQST